jgi:hypothetical protein
MRRTILVMSFGTVLLGLAALVTPWMLDQPGIRWLWRFQEPMWPIGVGALWVLCGACAAALADRPRAAAALLLVAAFAQPLALLSGCGEDECGYGFWHMTGTVIPVLDVGSIVLAVGAGILIGRTLEPPRTRTVPIALAVVSTLGAVLALALAGGGWVLVQMDEGNVSFTSAAELFLLAVTLGTIAGTLIGLAGARRPAAVRPTG